MTPPSGGNAGLITIPNSTLASITFASSNFVADAGNYAVKIEVGFGAAFTTIIASAVFTYTYVDVLCITTDFI